MAASNSNKPLTSIKVKALKPGQSIKDTAKNAGLNVSCNKIGTKTFFYRYRSPIENRVKRATVGIFVPDAKDEDLTLPEGKKLLGLSSARQILSGLKAERKAGVCPATRLKKEKEERELQERLKNTDFTMQKLVEVYLSKLTFVSLPRLLSFF